MNFAIRDAHQTLVATPLTSSSQLPALTNGPKPLAELFKTIEALDKKLDEASSHAIHKVGINTPAIAPVRARGIWGGLGTGLTVAAAGAAVAFSAFELTWVGMAFTGAISGLVSGTAGRGIWDVVCDRWQRRASETPPAPEDLKALRAVADISPEPVVAAALGRSAANWAGTLRTRQVRGFEAQEMLDEIRARGGKVSIADDERAQRFEALRTHILRYEASEQTSPDHLKGLNAALSALHDDEKLELAPIILERIFHEEAPIRNGWAFKDAYALHARVWQIARGEADPMAFVGPMPDEVEETKPKSRSRAKAAAEPEVAAEVKVEPTFAIVEAQSAVATMDDAIRDFEAALLPTLSRPRSVTAESITSAMNIANGASATPVATVGIGARAKRFIEQLDQRQLYGHEARLQLQELVERGEQLGPGLRDQIARIDAYRAAVDLSPPAKLNRAGVDNILGAIDKLLPCDQRPAAQRAYDRYFDNGVAITKLGRDTVSYDDAQRFLMALRKYIKE